MPYLSLSSYRQEKEIEEISDVLMNADAISCDAMFEPQLYCSMISYEIPYGYCVRVDFNKLAAALYDHGYHLTKGDAIKDEQEIDVHSSDT